MPIHFTVFPIRENQKLAQFCSKSILALAVSLARQISNSWNKSYKIDQLRLSMQERDQKQLAVDNDAASKSIGAAHPLIHVW